MAAGQEIRLKVGGMKCGGCQAAVTKALQSVDGVKEVTVALDPGSATVGGSASADALIAAVESAGKTASLLGGPSGADTTVAEESAFAPLSATEQLVQLVNCGCLFGWFVVGAVVSARLSGHKVGALLPLFPTVELGDGSTVWCSGPLELNAAGELAGWNTVSTLVVILELLCCVEVLRMLTGSLRGNVTLGVGLHYTRLFVCFQIFPLLPDHAATYTVLLAWAVTEVARYPFYIAPSSFTTTVRYACPVVTFPIGAAAEAYACFLAVQTLELQQSDQQVVKTLASIQIVVNTFGGVWAYPAMVSKALKGPGPKKAKAE